MEEDNVIIKWAQEDVETLYNLLNNDIYIYIYLFVYKVAVPTNTRHVM